MRIQSLPERLMNRLIATRAASICRSVTQAGSSAFRPYSPKASVEPRQALPRRRPRCCLRYFTFFGISMASGSCLARRRRRRFRTPFAAIDPALHPDHPVGRVGLRKAVINVGIERLQRQPPLQVPFLARNLGAVEPPGHAHLDALAAEPQRRI